MAIRIGKRQSKENTPVVHIGINPYKNIAPSRVRMKYGHLYSSTIPNIDTTQVASKQAIEQLQIVDQQHIPSEQIVEEVDKIVLVSTWNIKCGIAAYTEDLYNELNKICPHAFVANPINGGKLDKDIKGKLTHLQHEFGIIPDPPNVSGKVIITWHTVTDNIIHTMRRFESSLDVVAHIITCERAQEYIDTSKDVYTVSLGSKLMPNIKKEDARKRLNIDNIDMPIGFVFGFQSPNKNYDRLIRSAKNTNIHLIISGSVHCSAFSSRIPDDENVTFLNRYLTNPEVDLYALASDLLLFDYIPQEHYSSSSALHRTIGAGRPVVCVNTRHFSNIEGMPKFDNQQELEKCIKYALDNQEYLGRLSLEFAEKTNWSNVAQQHIDIYRKYVDL